MSSFCSLFVILTLFSVGVQSEELFCSRDRQILLSGIFNYENVLFAYSWKFVDPNSESQNSLVWRFETRAGKVVSVSESTSVNDIFPGLMIFKFGFGLTVKCDKSDITCKSYRQLIFVFFQANYYKVYRLANDVIFREKDRSRIPWGLSSSGLAEQWYFGASIDNGVDKPLAIMLADDRLFMVAANTLYVSRADVTAKQLEWSVVGHSNQFSRSTAGFVVGSFLFIYMQESSEVIVKYDLKGKELEKIKVWDYFRCDRADENGIAQFGADEESESTEDKEQGLVTTIVIVIFVVVLLVNLIAGVFWLSVFFRRKQPIDD